MASYGDGLIHITNVDMWKDKLRITVLDTVEESEICILMTHDKAHELAVDLMNFAMGLITKELINKINSLPLEDKINNIPISNQKDIETDSKIVSIDSFRKG